MSSNTRPGRGLTAVLMTLAIASGSVIACTSRDKAAPPPPVDDTATAKSGHAAAPSAPGTNAPPHKMSTGSKVVILAGAAALYYMYKKHQSAAATTGPEGQYYLSKNGRVYYRDADHRAHWVTPPPEGISVPEEEAQQYKEFEGYENRKAGRDLTGLGNAEIPDPS